MMRLLSKAAALLTLGLLLMPSVFAHSPAKRNSTKDESAKDVAASSSEVSKAEDSPAHAADPASISASTEPAPQSAGSSHSAPKSRDARPDPKFLPMLATTGTLGLFTVETADTLPQGGFAFSASGNKFGRTPGSVTVFQTGLEASYGLTDRITIYGSYDPYGHVHVGNDTQLSLAPTYNGFFPYQDTILPTIPFTEMPGYVQDFPFASQNGGGLGNIVLGVKFGLLSERLGDPVSISLRNDLSISTITNLTRLERNGTQGSPLSEQLSLAVSKQWSNVITTTFNTGYMIMRDPRDFLGNHALNLPDQFKSSAGFLLFPESRFQPMAEYSAVVFFGGTPDATFGARDPVDAVWGLRAYLCKYFAVDLGYRYMLNLRQLNDRHGFVVKLGTAYWNGKAKTPAANHSPTVSLSADKNLVHLGMGDAVTIRSAASDPNGDALTYTWSASGGHIVGDGPQVRWLSNGTAAGSYTVKVTVDDGHGGHASASTEIRVEP